MALASAGSFHDLEPLPVVLLSGDRGSAALARQLVSSTAVRRTVVINGYDDGASTGEVRRWFGRWPSRRHNAAARRAVDAYLAAREGISL